MSDILNNKTKWQLLRLDFTPFVDLIRKIGIFFISGDYSKFALGWFQLASMAELALAIQFEVSHLTAFKMTQFEHEVPPDDLTSTEISANV